jgi:hypothetical protein
MGRLTVLFLSLSLVGCETQEQREQRLREAQVDESSCRLRHYGNTGHYREWYPETCVEIERRREEELVRDY